MKLLLYGLVMAAFFVNGEARRCCGKEGTIPPGFPLHSKPTVSPTLASHVLSKNPDSRLERVIKKLKIYGNLTYFDVESFEKFELSFAKNLLRIRFLVDKEIPSNKHLSEKLLYAEDLFHKLVSSKELLKFFGFRKSRPQKLVCKLIRLNIKLLTLYNSQGIPNYQIEQYDEIVDNLIIYLNNHITMFEDLVDVPLAVHLAFTFQANQANDALLVLSKFRLGKRE